MATHPHLAMALVLSARVGILVVLLMTAGATSAHASEKWGPFRGQLVDEATGTGIPGAVVIAIWWKNEPNPIQMNRSFFDAVEAVTDADGRFEIPRYPKPPFFDFQILPVEITYFAPAYLPLREHVTPPDGTPFVAPTRVLMERMDPRKALTQAHRRQARRCAPRKDERVYQGRECGKKDERVFAPSDSWRGGQTVTAKALNIAVLGVFSIWPTTHAFALNQATHKIVNEEAAIASTMDPALKRLGIPEGVAQFFRGRTAFAWVGEGGIREDDGVRFLRHFHNPLKPWTSAGLEFFGQHQSSIHWMQRPFDCAGVTLTDPKEWSWGAGRCYFYHALDFFQFGGSRNGVGAHVPIAGSGDAPCGRCVGARAHEKRSAPSWRLFRKL